MSISAARRSEFRQNVNNMAVSFVGLGPGGYCAVSLLLPCRSQYQKVMFLWQQTVTEGERNVGKTLEAENILTGQLISSFA